MNGFSLKTFFSNAFFSNAFPSRGLSPGFPRDSGGGVAAQASTVLLLGILGVLLSGALFPEAVHAQETGAVAGVIVDGESGETLPGANVVVQGTQRGTSSDMDGRYRIADLQPGTYDLVFSFVSYQSKTVTGVEVNAGETATLDVTLSPETQELEEVVVTAEVAHNTEAGLLRERQRAAGVSDAISAEEIGEAGSSDAADAMKKVTGASVVGGKYVNVRGLSGRYVNTHLNGAKLPSADPDGNSVQFDLLPADLLQNIVTSKTFTPDQPGDFSGGNIQINTRSYPEDLTFTVSSSISYNSEVGLGQSILRATDGAEEAPAVLGSGSIPSIGIAFTDDEAARRLNAVSRAFSQTMIPVSLSVPVNQSYGLSFGNEFSVLGDRPLGVVASVTYDQNVSGYENGQTGQFTLTGDVSTVSSLRTELLLEDRSGTREELIGSMVNLSFQPWDNHDFSLNGLYNRSDEQRARFQSGALPLDLTGGDVFETRTLRQTERTLWSGQLQGEHLFGSNLFGSGQGGRATWNASMARTKQNEPDLRLFANHYSPAERDTTYRISPSIYNFPSRYFRELTETNRSGELSVTVPLARSIDVKVGGNYLRKTREFRERRFEYKQDQASYRGDASLYFGTQAGMLGQDDLGRNRFGTYIDDATLTSNNYDGEATVGAGFAMVDMALPFLPQLRFVGGVRVEYTDFLVENQAGRSGTIQQTDYLPSANLTYTLTDEMNARLAYGRTLARPTFIEFAPFQSFGFIGGRTEIGNPDLERTLVDNVDLRWEWFIGPGEILAVSGFYKQFQQPIERVIDPRAAGDNNVVQYQNVDRAIVRGLELEARKRLGFLASGLRHVKLGGNLTLAQSAVSIAPRELELIRAYNPDADDTRSLQGQSDYLANLSAGYENPELGTTANLFYNVFGDRLHAVANGPDLYERPRHTLELVAAQRLPFGLQVKLEAENLLNAEYEVTQRFKGTDFANSRYELGRTLTLGVKYRL